MGILIGQKLGHSAHFAMLEKQEINGGKLHENVRSSNVDANQICLKVQRKVA